MSGSQQMELVTDGVRREVVSRLRLQVAMGDYHPPTDELVDRLVGLIMARQSGRRPETGA